MKSALAPLALLALAGSAVAQPAPGRYVLVPESTFNRVMLLDDASGGGINNDFITATTSAGSGPTAGLPFSLPLEVLQPLTPAGSVAGSATGAYSSAISNQILVSDQSRGSVYVFNLAGDTLTRRIGPDLGGGNVLPLNIRGIEVVNVPGTGPVLYIACGAVNTVPAPPPTPFDSRIVRINLTTGQLIDSFGGPVGTLDSPWDVKAIADPAAPGSVAILVSDTGTDDVTKWDTSGNLIGTLVTSAGAAGELNFAQQIAVRPVSGGFNILVGSGSGPSSIGLYEYTQAGAFLARYSVGTGPRGVHVLGNGSALFTFGNGINAYNFTSVSITPLVGNVSARLSNALIIPAACPADCDASGGLSPADFTCFLAKYRAGDSSADCDASGGLSPADFTCFLAKYRAGCP